MPLHYEMYIHKLQFNPDMGHPMHYQVKAFHMMKSLQPLSSSLVQGCNYFHLVRDQLHWKS
jgi:hypothetical protein